MQGLSGNRDRDDHRIDKLSEYTKFIREQRLSEQTETIRGYTEIIREPRQISGGFSNVDQKMIYVGSLEQPCSPCTESFWNQQSLPNWSGHYTALDREVKLCNQGEVLQALISPCLKGNNKAIILQESWSCGCYVDSLKPQSLQLNANSFWDWQALLLLSHIHSCFQELFLSLLGVCVWILMVLGSYAVSAIELGSLMEKYYNPWNYRLSPHNSRTKVWANSSMG